jgi:hypothetical protein
MNTQQYRQSLAHRKPLHRHPNFREELRKQAVEWGFLQN